MPGDTDFAVMRADQIGQQVESVGVQRQYFLFQGVGWRWGDGYVRWWVGGCLAVNKPAIFAKGRVMRDASVGVVMFDMNKAVTL